MDLAWMAWTWQTAVFFGAVAALLAVMTAWEWLRPGGAPRRGLLGITTTRGDRLFISLLAAAYIHLLWLAFASNAASGALWLASLLAVAFAALVFWKG